MQKWELSIHRNLNGSMLGARHFPSPLTLIEINFTRHFSYFFLGKLIFFLQEHYKMNYQIQSDRIQTTESALPSSKSAIT